MVTHAGTHVDAARHFYPDGKSIDQYEMERVVCRGVGIDLRCEGAHEVSADELAAADPGIREGDAVHVACDPAHIHLFDAGVAGARLTPIA